MAALTRRKFLQGLATLIALPSLVRGSVFSGLGAVFRPRLSEIDGFCEKHGENIRAVSAVLLPESAGSGSGAALLAWLKGYRPEGEVLRFMRPPGQKFGRFPLENYERQLQNLRQSAGRDRLREIPRERLQAIILDEMESSPTPTGTLYAPPQGQDLFRDILAVFVRDSRTLDLCYQRKVGIFTCRGIDAMG